MRAVGERAYQFIFMGGQPEAFDIILVARLRVRHEYLRRRLLDDRARDPAFERILRALRREADDAVPFADRLFPILDPAHEHIVVERLPALINDDNRRAAIEDRKSTPLNSSH